MDISCDIDVQDTIVYILAVRHTAKKPLENEDLEEILEN